MLNRPSLFVLIAIGLLLLLPAGAGRVLLDLACGLLVVLLVLPVLLGGLGWVGWKVLQSRMQSCSAWKASFDSELARERVAAEPGNDWQKGQQKLGCPWKPRPVADRADTTEMPLINP